MVTLVILDGFGYRKEKFGNAIASAGTPNLDKLEKIYPTSLLMASGNAVGLPEGQMGNSEVGHLTLGSGRVLWQDLMKINRDIEDGSFFKNERLIKAMEHAKINNSALHLMGLLSDGGVHSHINHLFALIDMANSFGLKKVYIHAFLDGRDTLYDSGIGFIKRLKEKIAPLGYKIASLSGRVYAMDREQRYDRLQKAYDVLVNGANLIEQDAEKVLNDSYGKGVYDEFVEPTLLCKDGVICDNDSVIFYNFRSDRAREITFALTDKDFKHFKTKKFKNLLYSPMEEYAKEFSSLNVIYPPVKIDDNLSALIAKSGKKQFHIAETTKYAHVTFFFNGGNETPYQNEERVLIDSIDTQDFSYYPKMRAIEITEKTLDAIASAEYDFILVNYSNPDMIGHTGNFEATKDAIKCVDKQAYALALATLMAGGDCIITADHGNAEYMIDKQGNKVTSHTTNPVKCILVSEKHRKAKLKKGKSIANIAPTVLKLLGMDIPSSMEDALF